ncbi:MULTISPECIES: succinylglutamate desuccinylase/aspartoacylase family protein [Grimontia]|uniref:Succinylglutamate desuccinylase / Aspartoacylase family protein n=1 Tax=Grimontia marina TaxID=646534 RepID=A0A128F1P7_9GAMM|nr:MULTISPECIES: succinylglutamate desuccinylase/aspartoacylase family protein [Grimontia]WRW00530.1 succinylglutamate desuccinylase/aspartoacylase family protein [Grimontia sp. NTOU-MAR1]CZF80722.1 Succinylglutamate desuccinylase / Aspartoacylase family protein [Grimontia marina]
MTKCIEGNKIDGLSVISSLDVSQLDEGEHKFWFRTATDALAQWQHLPVWVFKGSEPGKNIVITAGVHGDEYNGVLSAQAIARGLRGKVLKGCVTIIPTINLSGMLHRSRDFLSSDPDVSCGNLNRHFPGNAHGNEPQRYLDPIWRNLLHPNADLAIDLHTQTSGSCYPLYVFADFRLDDSVNMARRMNPDAILDDPGEPGILETVWNQSGIPSITVEAGVGRYTDMEMVKRTVRGVFNIFTLHGLIDDEFAEVKPAIESAKVTSIRAVQGGFIIPQVELMQTVEKDQLLAIQYDSFGEVEHRYHAPEGGVVLSHNVESMRAAGSLVIRLIHPGTTP